MIITIGGVDYPVIKRGNGALPLLLTGPAMIFEHSNLLNPGFYRLFTVYFVDLFSKEQRNILPFEEELELVREKLDLKKVAIFSHSTTGYIGIRYARQYPDRVALLILAAMPGVWDPKTVQNGEKQRTSMGFFDAVASDARKQLFQQDQEQLEKDTRSGRIPEEQLFDRAYDARRAFFFMEPKKAPNVFKGVTTDFGKIARFFDHIGLDGYDPKHYPTPLAVPVFLGVGQSDYSAPYFLWMIESRLIRAFENAKAYVFEKEAHYPMRSEQFVEKLVEFMEENALLHTHSKQKLIPKL